MLRTSSALACLLLLGACASAPPVITSAPSLPAVRGIVIDGPYLDLDLDSALEGYADAPVHQRILAEIEAIVAEAYSWAEWREVIVIAAPALDDAGMLHVSVMAEAPAELAHAPQALAWPPPEVVPAPTAVAGARPEPVIDAALSVWHQSESRVLIDSGERRLYLKRRDGKVVSFPVAVGTARTPTPPGDYSVEGVRRKPTWYPPASIRREYAAKGKTLQTSIPPGPGNPLGEWFVRLQNGIGIHGTNMPRSIGRAASHGCVRMHDVDVAQVVAELKRGDGVTVVRTRAALTASN